MKKIVSLVACSLLLASLACIVVCSSNNDVAFAQTPGASVTRWEYKIEDLRIKINAGGGMSGRNLAEQEAAANQLGSEVWELVAADGGTYYFKRPKR